jgi:hypothetical protein
MPRHAGGQGLPPDPPEETATSVALEILQAVAEDPFMRSSYRQRAREHPSATPQDRSANIARYSHRDDADAEEDESC